MSNAEVVKYLEHVEQQILMRNISDTFAEVTNKYTQSMQPIYQVLGDNDGDQE